MSLNHQYQSEFSTESEQYTFDEILKNEQKAEYYKWQIENMYNKEKYYTPHDIIGTKGLVKAQNDELDIKKASKTRIKFRFENELYLRDHPELNTMIASFLFKVLEEKPTNILSYAGKFFDQEKLKEIIDIEKKHYIENDSI